MEKHYKKPLTLRSVFMVLAAILFLLALSACGSSSGSEENAAAAQADTPAATTVAATDTPLPPATDTAEPTDEPTAEPTDEPTAEPTETPTEEPTATPTTEPSPTPTETPTAAPSVVQTYIIQQDGSEARFYIDEVLFGDPKTVLGRTPEVSGEITMDLADPQSAQISAIQVNARDLTTDNEFRNRALRSQILDTGQDDFQFITFTPTEISGLPDGPVIIGNGYSLEVTGDLQIRDFVHQETFIMTVTAVSENELEGTGETTIMRADYGLQIPSVTGVANVSEEVRLEFDFTAVVEG